MQSFIVLGIIPGTNIQVTLNFWLVVYSLLLLVVLRSRIIIARNRLQAYLAVRQIARAIDRGGFSLAG